MVPQLWAAPNNVVTRFQILVRPSETGATGAGGVSVGAAAFFGATGFATNSKSVSLRSLHLTFTLSSDNSPCTGCLANLGIAPTGALRPKSLFSFSMHLAISPGPFAFTGAA